MQASTTSVAGKSSKVPFWPSLLVTVAGTVLSTMLLGLPARLAGALLRLAVPRDMAIIVVGPCPEGWRQSDTISGRVLIAADGITMRSGSTGSIDTTVRPPSPGSLGYVAVAVCQIQ
jgi:hypothetical protein